MKETDTSARTERLIADRRQAAAKKQAQTLEVIERLLALKERVTFADVHRAAKVSTWFVYNNAVVRSAINDAMRVQSDEQPASAVKTTDDRTTQGVRAELADARAEIRDLREERGRLRLRLQRNLGDQIDVASKRDLLERLRVLEDENEQLQQTLLAANTEHANVRLELEQAQSELDGARLALRQTMRAVSGNHGNV